MFKKGLIEDISTKAIYWAILLILVWGLLITLERPLRGSSPAPILNQPTDISQTGGGIKIQTSEFGGINTQLITDTPPTYIDAPQFETKAGSPPNWITLESIEVGDRIYFVGSSSINDPKFGCKDPEKCLAYAAIPAEEKMLARIGMESCGKLLDLSQSPIFSLKHDINPSTTYTTESQFYGLYYLTKSDYNQFKMRIKVLCSNGLTDSSASTLSAEEIITASNKYPPIVKSKEGVINVLLSLYDYIDKEKIPSGNKQLILSGQDLSTALKQLKFKTDLPIDRLDKLVLTMSLENNLGLGIYFKEQASFSMPYTGGLIKLHAPKDSHWDLSRSSELEQWDFRNLIGDFKVSGTVPCLSSWKLPSLCKINFDRTDYGRVFVYRTSSGKLSLYGQTQTTNTFFEGSRVITSYNGIDIANFGLTTIDNDEINHYPLPRIK